MATPTTSWFVAENQKLELHSFGLSQTANRLYPQMQKSPEQDEAPAQPTSVRVRVAGVFLRAGLLREPESGKV